jgi:hypothetical protein
VHMRYFIAQSRKLATSKRNNVYNREEKKYFNER